MKNQILLCLILLGIITTISTKTLTRRNRQINSEEEEDSEEAADGWDWSDITPTSPPIWIPTTTARPTRPNTTARPTRPTSTIRPTTISSTATSSSSMNSTTTTPFPVVSPSLVIFNRCMSSCMRTPEYNPLCADLGNGRRKQYSNEGERNCANTCGESSTILFRGSCTALV